jgi:peptidyl-prolyl cis-trans isomerase C
MSKLRMAAAPALMIALMALSGCGKKPEGQVVAIVNGEEVTLTELNSEISDLNLPPTADKTQVRTQVLQRMVDRRLIAQAAKESGLDRDPAYISQQRKMNEQLLVTMYGRKAMDTVATPENVAIDQFIARNPTMFAERTRYRLDQIQFDLPSDPSRLKALETAHSMTEVAERLNGMNITFQRGSGAIDSGTVPPEVMQRIRSLPAGEPFLIPQGTKMVVSVITGSEPVTMTPEQMRPLAAQAMRGQSLNKIGEQRLGEARAKAKIEYQTGYAPAATPKAAAPGVPAAK